MQAQGRALDALAGVPTRCRAICGEVGPITCTSILGSMVY